MTLLEMYFNPISVPRENKRRNNVLNDEVFATGPHAHTMSLCHLFSAPTWGWDEFLKLRDLQ